MRSFAILTLFAVALVGCGDDDVSLDASSDARSCASDVDCDDGVFCNGAERCDEGACASGHAPCEGACDEGTATCSGCAVPDADGDGRASIACGGDDCDDDDPRRYPGNTEICDADDVDEDCDPSTYGRRDLDGDDVTSSACCNGESCGEDCDDNRAGVGPTATETCNGLDDDCDGSVDEHVGSTYTVDADGDGFGAVGGATLVACNPPDGYALLATDCDDDAPNVNPGNAEVCDEAMEDEDCDGLHNPPEDCSCSAGAEPRACSLPGVCRSGNEQCVGGAWSECSISPEAVDLCDGRDEDCNGVADDPFMCAMGSTRSCTTACGTTGTQTCDGSCRWSDCVATEVCNGCDDDADGTVDDGFECALGGAATPCTNDCGNPGTASCGAGCHLTACVGPEVCDYCDDDGDGTTDDELLDAATLDRTVTHGADPCGEIEFTTGPADVFCSGGQMQFVDTGGTDEHAIGAWLTEPLHVGYGPVVVDVDLFVFIPADTDPGWGMGFVMGAREPRTLAGEAGLAGIPVDYTGIAFEHAWKNLSGTFGTEDLDQVRVHELTGHGSTVLASSPTPPASVIRIDAGTSSSNKRLIYRVTYDRGNEVTGRARSVSLHACLYAASAPGTPPCDPVTEILRYEGDEVPDIAAGASLYFGVTHGARGLLRDSDVQSKVRWWLRQSYVSEQSCTP